MTEQKKAPTDWESIEKDYRAGVLSIREVAKIHGVSDTAIRKKAKAESWQRDLTERVNEQVRAELVRNTVRASDPQTEREIVDAAAATVVQVVRSHRTRIGHGNDLVDLLTKQLMDVAGKREDFEQAIDLECAGDKSPERRTRLMKAVALSTHAGMAVNLANALKVLIGLERQAFNLDAPAETAIILDATDATTASRRKAALALLLAKQDEGQPS